MIEPITGRDLRLDLEGRPHRVYVEEAGQGVPLLCWTIRSPEAEGAARRVADNVTFEGYLSTLQA